MTAGFSFDVPGAPVGKERPRVGARGNVYTPNKTLAYEAQVRLLAYGAARLAHWPIGFKGPCGVTIALSMPDARRRDIDNAVKSILDALQTQRRWGVGIIADDSQVDELHVFRGVNRESPGARISLKALPPVPSVRRSS